MINGKQYSLVLCSSFNPLSVWLPALYVRVQVVHPNCMGSEKMMLCLEKPSPFEIAQIWVSSYPS